MGGIRAGDSSPPPPVHRPASLPSSHIIPPGSHLACPAGEAAHRGRADLLSFRGDATVEGRGERVEGRGEMGEMGEGKKKAREVACTSTHREAARGRLTPEKKGARGHLYVRGPFVIVII